MQREEFIKKVNRLASAGRPFLFLLDFELKKPVVAELKEAADMDIFYDIKGNNNYSRQEADNTRTIAGGKFMSTPISREIYSEAFSLVMEHIHRGDSYLLNLTSPTTIETSHSMEEIFTMAEAPYKLLYKNDFLVFSPESFIQINRNRISSFPMKGTIDASLPNAKERLLDSSKEQFEHNTITDLIRNDLAIVGKNVKVDRSRYIEKISTIRGDILQQSSEISAELDSHWHERLGNIILSLLPAGSICGAPKQKTVEIIKKAEVENRGYFTGIFGIFDGKNLDSAVNIRYIEKKGDSLQYRSGGGITALSMEDEEYNEMLKKVYIPSSGGNN